MGAPACPLCQDLGGELVFQGGKFRVIRTDEGGFPAFYRLVWTGHVTEFSDLARADRHLCIDAVACLEDCLRSHLSPVKVNLATLGNVVAHLHWHVIARFAWDSHFPGPVWAAAQRPMPAADAQRIAALRPTLQAQMARQLALLPA